AVAQKILTTHFSPNLQILAYVKTIHDLNASIDPNSVSFEQIEANAVRCPDPDAATAMINKIKAARSEGNSLGGIVECVVRNCPPGLGEPVFDKLDADLAKAIMSLPATKGFEIGSGFAGTTLTGAEHNDPFTMEDDRVRTTSNRSGGIQGGISNGEPIVFRAAFKPTATIMSPQQTVTADGQDTELAARGRHDPCVLPRAIPMVEAMTALTLVDHALRQHAQNHLHKSP
ncbi:MAG: chorismate synthase, partial [Verrucomicrobiota bacterium]